MKPAERLDQLKEYYFSTKLKEVRALVAQGKPIINMGIGSPDLPPPPSVITALEDACQSPNAHQYQSYQGIPELRQAATKFYKTHYKVSLNSDTEIIPLMGSKEGILHISLAFLNPGEQALIPDPGYPTYTSVTKLVGAQPVYYNLSEACNWLPDLEQLAKQDLTKVKLMWVNYPHMPTGATASVSFFKDLIAFAKTHEILLINDNPYSFILNDSPQSLLSIEGAKSCVLELNSLSKSFNMAGWRVGFLSGGAQFLASVMKVKTQQDSGMFYGIQKGAVEALKHSQDWFDEINTIYEARQKAVWKLCDLLNLSYDKTAVGMFVWAKLNNGKTAEDMVDQLLHEKSIFIAPGSIFGQNGRAYVRFSLCVSLDSINEAISRL